MNNKENENNLTIEKNSLNKSNSDFKIAFTSELKNLKQDLLYYRNDILKDMRKLEEKINLKITEQSLMNSEQFNAYGEKIDQLSDKISVIDSLEESNINFYEKLKNYETFKLKIENQVTSMETKMNTLQKDFNFYVNNNERTINDNLIYPGIIGKNARFNNFRNFVDHILKNFQELNEFKENIKKLDFNSFKRKMNQNIADFRYAIADGYRNSVSLIQNNLKVFDSKWQIMVKNNDSIMEENNNKLGEFKALMNDYLSEFQKQFVNLEKNINDKLKEKINEFEITKNKIKEDMNNFQSNLELNKKIYQLNNEANEKKFILKENNINDNYNNDIINNEKSIINGNDENSHQNQNIKMNNNYPYITSKGRNNFIFKETSQGKNNIINEYQNYNENNPDKNDFAENFQYKMMNKSQTIFPYKSFANNFIDENSNLKSSKDKLATTQNDIYNKEDKLNLFNSNIKQKNDKTNYRRYIDLEQKDIPNDNYSVANIPSNIKIKKVILSNFLTKRNSNLRKSNSCLTVDKTIQKLKNNRCLSAKYRTNEESNSKKNINNLSRINKQKEIAKIKSNLEPLKTVSKKVGHQIDDNIISLMVMKVKPKINIGKNSDNLNKHKKKIWPNDRNKKAKNEKVQIGFGQTYREKNNIKELILINTKNFKKNRKIKL